MLYPDLTQLKRILVIKLRHHGDVLLTSPVFSVLKKNIPDARIDAFIYADSLQMLEGHPAIDDFLLYDKRWKKRSFFLRMKEELSLLRKIRKNGYDLVLNLTEGDRGAIAAIVSGSAIRVGFDPKGQGMLGKRSCYTHLVKNCSGVRHTVERQLDALRRIGIFPQIEERALSLHIAKEVQQEVVDLLQQEGIAPKSYILIHPTARWLFKALSAKQMAEVMRLLYERGECVVLSGGPDEKERAMIEQIIALEPRAARLNVAGKLSLKQLCALISFAKILLCVDSLPLHIASSVKTPVVALFGPTSEGNWGPWMHPQARVLTSGEHLCRPCYQDGCGGSKKSDCLLSLSPERIVEAIYNLKSSPK